MAGKFEPKVAVQLNPPKDDPISVEELAKCDGESNQRFVFGFGLQGPGGQWHLSQTEPAVFFFSLL